MANRSYMPPGGSIIKRLVSIFARVDVGEGGAVTLGKWVYPTLGAGTNARTYVAAPSANALPSGAAYPLQYQAGAEGVRSVTRTGVGLWTVQLQDNYQRPVQIFGYQIIAGGAGNIVGVCADSSVTSMSSNGGSTIGLGLISATGTLADPTSGSSINLTFLLADATEP